MPVRYSKSESLRFAVTVDENALRRLEAILSEESLGDVSYQIELADGGKANCETLEEVLALPNVGRRQIKSLTVSSGWKANARGFVSFGRSTFGAYTMFYFIEGDEKTVFHLSRRIEEYGATLKEWYSGISRMGWGWWFLVVNGLQWLPIVYGIVIQHRTFAMRPLFPMRAIDALESLAYGGAVGGLPFLLSYLTAYLFPRVIFAIGHGIERQKRLIYLRQRVLGGLAVAAGAGIIVALVTHR